MGKCYIGERSVSVEVPGPRGVHEGGNIPEVRPRPTQEKLAARPEAGPEVPLTFAAAAHHCCLVRLHVWNSSVLDRRGKPDTLTLQRSGSVWLSLLTFTPLIHNLGSGRQLEGTWVCSEAPQATRRCPSVSRFPHISCPSRSLVHTCLLSPPAAEVKTKEVILGTMQLTPRPRIRTSLDSS